MQRQSKPSRLKVVQMMAVSAVTAIVTMALASAAQAVSGSWSSQLPSVMVAMSDRVSSSTPIVAPGAAQVENAVIERIQWRYEAPPGSPVNAWLCHPEQCVLLNEMRGSTTALAGKKADAPLFFRFALMPGQRPVRVQGLQVIVNYQ